MFSIASTRVTFVSRSFLRIDKITDHEIDRLKKGPLFFGSFGFIFVTGRVYSRPPGVELRIKVFTHALPAFPNPVKHGDLSPRNFFPSQQLRGAAGGIISTPSARAGAGDAAIPSTETEINARGFSSRKIDNRRSTSCAQRSIMSVFAEIKNGTQPDLSQNGLLKWLD